MLKLSAERMRRGWSKAELARRAKLDQGTMSKIELGRVIPYPVQLVRVASALKMPADALMLDVEQAS